MKYKNYIIKVQGISTTNSKSHESTKSIIKGNYCYNGQNAVITYNESNITGFENCNIIITIYSNKKVKIKKYGEVKSTMIIENRKRNICNYKTPYGNFLLGITGKFSNINLYNNNCKLIFSYELDVNNSLLYTNTIIIECERYDKTDKINNI